MPNPGELLQGPSPGQPSLAYGRVSTLQALPATFNDPLFVVLPYDTSRAIRIDEWPAIHGATLPAGNAEVLIGFDEFRNPRCLWWAGTHT